MKYYISNKELDILVEDLIIEQKMDPSTLLKWLDEVNEEVNRRKDNFNFSIRCPRLPLWRLAWRCAIQSPYGNIMSHRSTQFDAVKDYIANKRSFKLRFWNSVKRVRSNHEKNN